MPLITVDEETYEKLRKLAFEQKTTQKALVEEAVATVFK